jgi:hypothetical protein
MFLTNYSCRVPCFRLVFEAVFGEIVHVSRTLWKRDAPSELESSCLILRLPNTTSRTPNGVPCMHVCNYFKLRM